MSPAPILRVLLSEISTFPNVEMPETFKSSNSVCPSTTISAFISTFPPKVDKPDTLRLSNSV